MNDIWNRKNPYEMVGERAKRYQHINKKEILCSAVAIEERS